MKSISEISREIFTKEEVAKADASNSYHEYMNTSRDRFVYFYKTYNGLSGNNECSNCCTEVDNKRWCSFECFLSDVGA